MTWEQDREPVESGGPEDRLLTWNKVRDVTGLSRSTAWRLQRLGDFPEPVRISVNRVGWWESELTAWKETRKSRKSRRPMSLTAPRAPKLIESARSARPGIDRPLSEASRQSQEVPPSSAAMNERRPRPRKRRVSADQIDFGF
ncbi:Prophage CP4-57 regulatory protein (AlpA) [compost metagenome]